jgi:tetratricopeptide (TPR) repeat protein
MSKRFETLSMKLLSAGNADEPKYLTDSFLGHATRSRFPRRKIDMYETLNLNIILTPPPAGSLPETLASVSLQVDALGLSHTGDLLETPLKEGEENSLRWYLEEYWKWPYEQFRERGEEIEELLPVLGKRIYQAVFGSASAQRVVQPWNLQPAKERQISIVSDIPRVLSLPWELLHDEQGFLTLRAQHPVSLVRRLSQQELPTLPTRFEPPLRILLVIASPDDAGFVDSRGIARELLEAVSDQVEAGTIALEFLRPPTLPALRERLSDSKLPPVHVLHFDGHGAFGQEPVSRDGLHIKSGGQQQGLLAFENEEGKEHLVSAGELAQVLQDSGVRMAIFNACQSAVGALDDVFSSVATRLIQGGIDAVVAMSASVLEATATRYVEAFYRSLSTGVAVPVAHGRACQALHADPRRHLTRRFEDIEGEPVRLRDWWLPHFYQQRPLLLEPVPAPPPPSSRRTHKKASQEASLPALSQSLPAEPRHGFSGRSRELLQIERALLHKRLVVIHGFGGMGKTALAREAAEWFTRTGWYQRACFISFEQGGDATMLLSVLGAFLGICDGDYHPSDSKTSLARVQRVVKRQRTMVIADNLESILPAGEAALEPEERARLWQVLLKLRKLGVGVLLTTRDISFGESRLAPGKHVIHLPLQGLLREDAYELATHLLEDLRINRARAPYAELRALLAELDHHPLAIQLVLPALRDRSLAIIRAEFAALLPTFVDDTATGRNRSLLASLDYSLRRLRQEQRVLLPRLALFEGGARENDLLAITQIPQAEWTRLRAALEQAALLVAEQVHESFAVLYLHFHPVLLPSLRQAAGAARGEEERALHQRYARRYAGLATYLEDKAFQHPEAVYALVRRELPNLHKALELLLQAGEVEAALDMANSLAGFLDTLGLMRERDQLRRRVEQALAAASTATEGGLTLAEHLQEISRAEDERRSGKVRAAFARLSSLLARIQALPEEAEDGSWSYSHCFTLRELGCCLRDAGQLDAALGRLGEALVLLEALLKQRPENRTIRMLHATLLDDLGDVLMHQGQFAQAQARYEQALQENRAVKNTINEAVTLESLGTLALLQQDYPQARSLYLQALEQYRAMGDPARQAVAWHNLGGVAQEQQAWAEAERCLRESLALRERVGNTAGAASTCNLLAIVADGAGRPAEAEGWWKGALERIERVEPGGMDHARCLSNLAGLLVHEVQAGRAARSRLVEARRYAEQARRIKEQPGVSAEIWWTYANLAMIAELEEQPEVARDYRRQERERYAAFAGNRYLIDQQHAPLIEEIVAAARGDMKAQAAVEIELPQLEEQGWQVSDAVYCIWQGERDWQVLAEGLEGQDALLILRVLETLASTSDAPDSTKG